MSATDAPEIDYEQDSSERENTPAPAEPRVVRRALGRTDILSVRDIKVHEIDTPEWGEGSFVYVRRLNSEETNRIENSVRKVGGEEGEDTRLDMRDYYEKLFVLGVCDEDGNAIFEIDRPEDTPQERARKQAQIKKDVAELRKKSGLPIHRAAAQISKLSWEKKDVAKLVKNSEPGRSEDFSLV